MKIISQETIKPSSPTPPHLKTHVLSLLDNYMPHAPVPFIFFYRNYNNGDINILKKSLSRCLTQYYPFAGRILSPFGGHIDCNDEGVEFLEAYHDSRLDDYIRKEANHESLRELHPNVSITNMVAVQLNHFTGGGVAVAVSISHKLVDGFTMATFINQWAKVTRGGSSFKPYFLTPPTSYNNVERPEITISHEAKHVTKSFVFPNSKINRLQEKVMNSMGITLSRVEVLTSLLFKCSVDAATTKSGLFKPSILVHPINMRNKMFKNDPEKAAGNILSSVVVKMDDSRKITLNEVVAKLRRGKMEAREIRDVQEIGEKYASMVPMLIGDPSVQVYWTTSFCWFPLYEVDFGWGRPVQVKYVIPEVNLILMDTPDKDGIEATIRLPEEEMLILQQDKELLAFIDIKSKV
ncbi:putative vinorine synthase [Helianthus annuus]|nr:putative vinorine synthase [Helianthus annuus]KAJ0690871.1 putative vinorine synthase [Helianthus annuus]KAJ0872530.1 putative vinorine synthase [Helianthus annuus]